MWDDRVDDTTVGPALDRSRRRPSLPLRSEPGRHGAMSRRHRTRALRVDCDTCTARGRACDDCVIGVLLGPPGSVDLDGDEQAALSTLAASGMVPPLRLVHPVSAPTEDEPDLLADLQRGPRAGRPDDGWDDGNWDVGGCDDDGWGAPAGDSM